MPAAGDEPRLQPFFGYRNASRLNLTVRALRGVAGGWDHASTFARLRALLKHYASRELPGLPVTLRARHGTREAVATGVTDGEGYCRFDLAFDGDWPLPERSSWEAVTLTWSGGGSTGGAPLETSAWVLAPGSANRLAVISDIDDTIIETGAHDLMRNWRRVLAQMPAQRLPVPGVADLFARLGGGSDPLPAGAALSASRRPFFYVSSSPWNLFDYLLAFKTAHKLPVGPMLLRDWGLNRETILPTGHGAHKRASVGDLLSFYEGTRFALIGDSTQADALAYADAVRDHPGRIAGVFIRKAPGADVSVDEAAALTAIDRAGVPLWTGESFDAGEAFLASLGFAESGDTAAIVETIAEAPAKPSAASAAIQAPAT